ncbi:MAG: MFS transporter [Planctomycetes bacterium]|nr:MFS transporter [Planctomycetota bacterium]MCB9904071.1 MFS transporter [Planctomycetota bacterium]
MSGEEGRERPGLLERLALHRPELRAWALYDWANSAMITVIVAAIYPIYFSKVAARGFAEGEASATHAEATVIALLCVAVIAPLLGAVADRSGCKKRLLGACLALGVVSTAGLATVGEGDWRLGATLFVLVNIGAAGSFVFYDALLPHVAREGELDRVSTSGFALGYLGGGLALGGCLLVIQKPAWFGLAHVDSSWPVRVSFLVVAAWWLVFSVPLFRRVKEPEPLGATRVPFWPAVRGSMRDLRSTLRDLWALRSAFWMLVAFLIYNDGIATIYRMAAIYGDEVGIEQGALIGAILAVQFIGIPTTFAFGALAQRFGTKRMILVGVVIYALSGLMAYRMSSKEEFFLLAGMIALVQGGTQALSRSLYASLVPARRSGEFFGLFAVLDRFAGVIGPLLFAVCASTFESSRAAVLPLIGLFVIGGAVLARVDVVAGRRAVRDANVPAAEILD